MNASLYWTMHHTQHACQEVRSECSAGGFGRRLLYWIGGFA